MNWQKDTLFCIYPGHEARVRRPRQTGVHIVKFIIEPQKEDCQYSVLPVCTTLAPVTTCMLCSENPRFCPPHGPGNGKP